MSAGTAITLCAVAGKYGLRELRGAAYNKMALNYKVICESEEFLAHISAEKSFWMKMESINFSG